MVSPDKLKKEQEEFSKVDRNRNLRKKRKAGSLLKSKKFYLYFKNLSLQTKFERQLDTLGAKICPYIGKDVNYVLTDTPGYNGKASVVTETSSIVSPQCYSVSPATSISGDDFCMARKSRTRTEAMLERVSVQTQSTSSTNNAISTAISWNIPVYSVDYFQALIDKKLSQTQPTNGRSETKNEHVRVFEKRYLKLEHIISHKYRPEFKEVSKWPFINTNTLLGTSPFEKKPSKKSARKEKKHADKKESQRMNRTCSRTPNEAGYCEICAVHYTDLTQHVTTNAHLKFICNDKNYADLDNCIKTRSIEAFLAAHHSSVHNSNSKELNTNDEMGRNLRKSVSLHLNNNNENSSVTRSLSNAKLLADESLKQPLQVQCNGFASYHLRKSTAKSDPVLMKSATGCYTSKDLLRETRKMYASCPDSGGGPGANSPAAVKDHAPLSPVEEESLHRLRSRKSLLLPAILIGTTAEDTSKNRSNNNNALSPHHTPGSNHFLRSSSSPKSLPCQHATRNKQPGDDGSYRKPNATIAGAGSPTTAKNAYVLQHFTRSKLNNVAASPPPRENEGKRYSRASLSPRDEIRVNGKPCKRKSSLVTTSDEEDRPKASSPRGAVPSYQCNKTSKNSVCNEAEGGGTEKGQRKRMSLEEKFLHDNQEYYKVEMLRTKLRSTEFYCNREISQTSKEPEPRQQQQPPPVEPKKPISGKSPPVVMRFRKVRQRRQSALQILNSEAEDFMFGRPKKEDEPTNEADDEPETKPDTADDDDDCPAEVQQSPEKKKPPATAATENGRRAKAGKKRRTHAEVFIHDNLDYYKFEISGSRLRHQNADEAGSGSGGVSVKSEAGKSSCSASDNETATPAPACAARTKVKEEVLTDDETQTPPTTAVVNRRRGKPKKSTTTVVDEPPPPPPEPSTERPIKEEPEVSAAEPPEVCERPAPPDSISFAFESIPCKEPWYQAFQRLDACDERYIHIPSSVYFTRYRDLPPVRRPVRCRVNAAAAPKHASPATATGSSAAPSPSSPRDASMLSLLRRKRRSRFGRFIVDDKPRKSPRCHASTLAILSSLGRRRSRKFLTQIEHAKTSPSKAASGATTAAAAIPTPAAGTSVVVAGGAAAAAAAAHKSDLENKALLAEVSRQYQARLKEAVATTAKEADDHFIEVFSSEDCGDRYLRTIKPDADGRPMTNGGDAWAEAALCCMQIDQEILHDAELLGCFVSDGPEEPLIDDMAAFLASAQRCSSMEAAQDEEVAARSTHDALMARLLCRDAAQDFSCNSSDCGASSTCEFLGFAEDGRTVSRKRKRKRPNMTGWPHDRSKRRQMRIVRVRHLDDTNSEAEPSVLPPPPSTAGDAKPADATLPNDRVSEADSECTDDDMPLKEYLCRKKRRTNCALFAGDEEKPDGEVVAATLTRRSSKAAAAAQVLPNSTRRLSQTLRRKSSTSYAVRKVR